MFGEQITLFIIYTHFDMSNTHVFVFTYLVNRSHYLLYILTLT
jgi:hypothetical protein